ncbi:MAG: peptidylprolyl isomerase [Cyclobacteriaceae bacterium]|nr:peptidylprolyl isomerase [Cyclobacteriaceae bacterium]
MRHVTVFLLIIILWSCGKPVPTPNVFSDPVRVQIAELQDRRQTDSLLVFLNHENPEYRRAAALAFASVQDTLVVEKLAILLLDADKNAQEAAAFALGQTGGTAAFQALSSWVGDSHVVQEALGKTATQIESSKLNAWGLYRLALRGKADSTHTSRAIQLLAPTISEQDRFGAAHFFGRTTLKIDLAEQQLLQALRSDSSAYIRMAVASALRKIVSAEVLQALKEAAANDNDYRVRVNAVRALAAFAVDDVAQNLIEALKDESEPVTIAAAETIASLNFEGHAQQLSELVQSTNSWRVKGNLYESLLASGKNSEAIVMEIIAQFKSTENPYGQAALLTALRQAPAAHSFVQEQFDSSVPVIKSSAAAALVSMNRHRLFQPSMQQAFIEAYRKGMQTGDAAVIGTVAAALMNPSLNYKKLITDYQFLYEAKSELSLPRDNEALQPLEAAIAYFEDRELEKPVANEFNHPIDWAFVKTIPRDQQVRIQTSKGDIIIQLFVEEAPGSVANFLQLTNAGYFNGKNFHRVVPNFVIQGGCNRGDGWGSEDYSIRSEFSMRKYKEGSVGMASAGKDTEGTQWFITHSPTPHLDGRYTIFAEVVSGMDVVHQMAVGDQIIQVQAL